ncbi:hypothetical protein V5T82_14620 [Magnetovibrio sp. PR-2]|uniref:hypothetical protein n=1 Tax=Magnetovibrio sp. PR-2 TaxID=3120356 RepID=UPI002FCE44E3
MIHGVQNNAMAEIALALAMGFFSIMVLTLVSMGSGLTPAQSVDTAHSPGVQVQHSEPTKSQDQSAQEDIKVSSADLVIYHAGRYLDADLKPLDPASLAGREKVVLAVDGNLPMTEALKAREGVPVGNLTIAPLDARWQKALKETSL